MMAVRWEAQVMSIQVAARGGRWARAGYILGETRVGEEKGPGTWFRTREIMNVSLLLMDILKCSSVLKIILIKVDNETETCPEEDPDAGERSSFRKEAGHKMREGGLFLTRERKVERKEDRLTDLSHAMPCSPLGVVLFPKKEL